MQAIRKNNGAQPIGKAIGFGTQQTAYALRGTLGVVKNVGVGLGVIGLFGTAAQYNSGQIGGGEASLDIIMGGVGFIPGYGWIASGAYTVTKPVSKGMMEGVRGYTNTHQGDGIIWHLDH